MDFITLTDAQLHRMHIDTLRDARTAMVACRYYEQEAQRLNHKETAIRAEFDRRQTAEYPEETINRKKVET